MLKISVSFITNTRLKSPNAITTGTIDSRLAHQFLLTISLLAGFAVVSPMYNQLYTNSTRWRWPHHHSLWLLLVGLCLSHATQAQFTQQGNKLVGMTRNASSYQGSAGALGQAGTALMKAAAPDGPTCSTYASAPNSTGSTVWGVYAIGNTVYAATETGLAISTDGGQTFGATRRTTANSGLATNSIYCVHAISGPGSNTIYVGTATGMSVSKDGGTSFTNYDLPSGEYTNGIYAVGNTVYAATINGLYISTDGGVSYTKKTGIVNSSQYGVY